MASSDLFQNLRKYVKGQIDAEDLKLSDPYITTIRENSTRGLSRIVFEFKNDDEFFKYLDVHDDDIWFAHVITNPYGDGYNFQDSSVTDEDFNMGYIVFHDFDQDNILKFKNVMKVVDPGFDYSDFPDEESNIRAANILTKLFEKETDRLVDDWSMEKEIGANKTAREHVRWQINKELEEKGFKLQDEFDTVSIDVGHLIMLYLQYGKIWLTFKGLFKQAFEDNQEIGGWVDNSYEFYSSSEFDSAAFNRDVYNYLEKLESITEDQGDFTEFTEMVDRIVSKFKPGVTYELPKLKNVSFKIKDFDRDDKKVVVTLRHKLKSIERKVSEENFYNLLYQPELFDFGFGNV